jgi:hypothetical protein
MRIDTKLSEKMIEVLSSSHTTRNHIYRSVGGVAKKEYDENFLCVLKENIDNEDLQTDDTEQLNEAFRNLCIKYNEKRKLITD